jgi:hypothetical protein
MASHITSIVSSTANLATTRMCFGQLARICFSWPTKQWQIYRAWERRFHSGGLTVETHPGPRGKNARYDEIEDHIEAFLTSLDEPAHRVIAKFEGQENQPERPRGCLRGMEVTLARKHVALPLEPIAQGSSSVSAARVRCRRVGASVRQGEDRLCLISSAASV